MSTVYERIRQRRLELDMTAEELAHKMSYKDKSSISKIENGKADIPQSKVAAFASALKTTSAYLMGWTDDTYDYLKDPEGRIASIPEQIKKELEEKYPGSLEKQWERYWDMSADAWWNSLHSSEPIPPGFAPLPETELLPRVGRIACGEPITAEENIEGYDNVPKQWRANFTLQCVGDSMALSVQDGDVVAIRKQPQVEQGEIAAVRIDGEATLKHVYLHDDYIELRPENPNYTSIIRAKADMNEVTIEGKAVGLCRSLE